MIKVKKFAALEKGSIFKVQSGEIFKKISEDKAVSYENEPRIAGNQFVVFHSYEPVLIGKNNKFELETTGDRLLNRLFFFTYKSSRPFIQERGLMVHHIEALYDSLITFFLEEIVLEEE